jgi:hypothetical protein
MSGEAKVAFGLGMLFGGALSVVTLIVCLIASPMNGAAKQEAVKAGKAEYYLDNDNNRQWRWKP